MKRLKNSAIILSLVLLTACNSGQSVQTSETVSESETSAVTTSAATTAKTESTTSAITTAETEAVPETEPAEAAEKAEIKYVEVSPDNEFIDYNFILNYQGTTDIGDLADKAVDFLKTTEYYSDSMKNIENINTEKLGEEWNPVAGEFYQRDVSVYFDKDGSIRPVVSAAYPADYDGDGKIETFIVVDMPSVIMPSPDIWNFLLFADSDGNIYPDVIDFYESCSASILDYGKSKQLVFGGWGGFRSYASIYGVKDSKPVTLYDHAAGGDFYKTDCFLTVFGLQGGSDFMYFDTAALEYRIIKGVEISHAEMAELDVSNTLCSDFGAENIDELPDFVEFYFIKPNYYLLDWRLTTGSVLFTYENGVFTRVEASNITRSLNINRLDVIAEFDIDKAVAEMKPVSDPFSPISKDSEFIDFEFIKNYQGTTDIGDLADKAVQYINNSNAFESDRKDADKFSDEKFSAYFDNDGNLIPKLLTAYPNDYDGDGKTETFIIMEMPLYMENLKAAVIRAYLLFADSDGNMNLCKHLDGFDPKKDAVLLNYGKYKHILFYDISDGGTGICIFGASDRSSKAVYHYGGVGSLKKDGCFLSVSDNRYSDYFMFFDTATQEYITLLGKNYGNSMPAPLGTNQNAEIKPVQK